ncbi:TetR/AcrR family transcriptional regulator [Goekera deserti]|uniref:TetR/AcrR family transcriptional regulator n=1 Tax=Goekera deserti TaxID=2497753 RepID=A0A7K3WHZ1_9ACTN|nr:TetR/AcrR family transcriptional regulator [Goekera deserti]NDI50394.1 TetR family transcriptional regulator [Goekera deserti]NEL55340.1 TetR/AcrR family transcriptional regulator [Goekera deserti]
MSTTSTPRRRPPRRRAVTAELLLDAALETFADVGFAAATIEDVCGRGGFTRGAFYSNFASKDELFAALVTRECRRDLGRADDLLGDVSAEPDPVAAAVDRCLELFRQDRAWTLVLAEFTLHAARHPAAAALLAETRERTCNLLVEAIERLAGTAGIALTVPAADLARAISALHEGVSLHQLTGGPAAGRLERESLLLLLRGATSTRPSTPSPES